MPVVKPAPGVVGGVSLLTVVELICAIHLCACLFIVCSASSVKPVDVAGVRVSGYMQCMTAAWFLIGMPFIIIGGVGSVLRVDWQIKAYWMYLIATLFVIILWIFIFLRWGDACNTLEKTCESSNGMAIFMMLVLFGIVMGCIYLVWSMLEYVKNRHMTELLRYQEPWEAMAMLEDDAAEELAKEKVFMMQKKTEHFHGSMSQPPLGVQHDSVQSNKVPEYSTFSA